MVAEKFQHIPVLAGVVPQILVHKPEGIYVDGTFGRGGHSRLILQKLGEQARLYAFDRDLQAVAEAASITDPRFSIFHSAFADMGDKLSEIGVNGVDGILLDIGVSSPQIDDQSRGFSFRFDGPLDMRMDKSSGQTVAEWLQEAEVKEIARVIKEYGEEKFSYPIAQAIDKQRKNNPLTTTRQLADLVASVVPRNKKDTHQHPATRTFQAFRIHINDELGQLRMALNAAGSLLNPGGILAVISFHSLEDRIVKRFFEAAANPGRHLDPRLPLRADQLPQPLFDKQIRVLPDDQECEMNPRARSSVLRYAVRTDAAWNMQEFGK